MSAFRVEIDYQGWDYKFRRKDWSLYAYVYPNAHNDGETWGVRIHKRDKNGNEVFYGGKFLGSYFSKEEALSIATNFVILETIPENSIL